MLRALALLAALHTAPAADSVAGAWKISGDVSGNPLNVTCTIKRAVDTLSGSCTDEAGPPSDLTGEVKDGKVSFQYDIMYQGQPLTLAFSGTLATPTQMKGSIEVRPMGVYGTFSAAPAPKKP